MFNPQDIFKKFGSTARHVLSTSQQIAQKMNSGIGSEHILLGLTVTTGNASYEILKENALDLEQVKMVLNLNNIRTNISRGLSKEAKDILEAALGKAVQLRHSMVESEHLLWAILSNADCRAYQVIQRLGADPEEIKKELAEFFQHSSVDNLFDNILSASPFFFPREMGAPETMPSFRTPPGEKSASATPFLDQYGLDLTRQAKLAKLDPVIGREKEISRTIQILCRRTKNNPVLIGEPGVGKTAIVEGLAQRIAKAELPSALRDKRVISLDLTMTVAGTIYRGQFEERIKRIIQEIIKAKNIIVFIDELHTVVGTGSAEGSMDAANILKPALAKGQLRLIGATTPEEYRKYIEKDAALERRLQPIKVVEPSVEETIKILQGIKTNYEQHHHVALSEEAVKSAAEMSKRYISDRFLPDKAIDLIDEAAAAKQIIYDWKTSDEEMEKLKKDLQKIQTEKELAAGAQNYQLAAQLKSQQLQLEKKFSQLKAKKQAKLPPAEVRKSDIAEVVSLWTGIPLENLIATEGQKLAKIAEILKKYIIGQDEAVEAVAQAIKRAKTGIANPNRPIGTFIFLGPTGVGKTELARVLAREVYSSDEALIKIDMSEFMEKHNLARLVGAPPGYVGYEEAGRLTETVRGNPYSLILLDEIEKAHPDVFNLLLQIMEDGYLTDAKGKKVNFKNIILIMTSNIGVNELTRQAAIGFQAKSSDEKESANKQYQQMKQTVLEELKKQFRAEFINRLDKIIVFKPLDKKAIRKIVDLQIEELIKRLKKEGIHLTVEGKVREFLTKVGYDPRYGARPVRRKISELIENSLSDKLINKEFRHKDKILVTLEKNRIVLKK